MLKKENYNWFKGLYKRNKKFLILSTAIFLISIFLGFVLANILNPFMGVVFSEFKRKIAQGQIQIKTYSIFLNNLKIALLIYLGGLLFGSVTVIYLITNGLFLGYAGALFPLKDFIIFTVPHGIFEITGIIIAGAAGFRLASYIHHVFNDLIHMEQNISVRKQFKDSLNLNSGEFWESLKLLGIAVILLLLAAFIEANITIALGKYIKTIF